MSSEAVYAAEDAAFGGTDFDERLPSQRVEELVAGVTGGVWWRSCGAPPVVVRAARAGAATSSARPSTSGSVAIRIADPTSSTVSHELAHALAGVDHGHDDRFRVAHVDVVRVLVGSAVAARLEQAYIQYGLSVGCRPWPAPGPIRGQGFLML